MIVIGVDPGPTKSAYIVLRDGEIKSFGFKENLELKKLIREYEGCRIGIEYIGFMGGGAGQSVFDTAFWVGRFTEAWCSKNRVIRIKRQKIKSYFNANSRKENADSRIRYELICKYGRQGTKNDRGATYGISGHVWSALAVATVINEVKIVTKT